MHDAHWPHSPDKSSVGERYPAVLQFQQFVEKHYAKPLTIEAISRAIGISERTLRGHCKQALGISPAQYVLLTRMRAVRHALCQSQPKRTTVLEIARQHGFNQMGRFAGRYRRVFGETPS